MTIATQTETMIARYASGGATEPAARALLERLIHEHGATDALAADLVRSGFADESLAEDFVHNLSIAEVDSRVKLVAAALPFPVELEADMGETFALSISLGSRGDADDPSDTAGIDPHDNAATWWINFPGESRVEVSDLTIDAPPAVVADWIAREVSKAGSPTTRG